MLCKVPLPVGASAPNLIHGSLVQATQRPKRHLDRFSRLCVYAQLKPEAFTMAAPFLLKTKLPLSMGHVNPHLIHGFLDPPEPTTQTVSRLVQPLLQGSLLWQTDRQTDRPRYSVGNNRPRLRTQYCDPALIIYDSCQLNETAWQNNVVEKLKPTQAVSSTTVTPSTTTAKGFFV